MEIKHTDRGLVRRKEGDRSGRAGFESGCNRDTARILLIGDRYALQSERVIMPDHTRPSHEIWSALVGKWSAFWCKCSFIVISALYDQYRPIPLHLRHIRSK